MGAKLRFWQKEKKDKNDFLRIVLFIIVVSIIVYFYMKKAKKK